MLGEKGRITLRRLGLAALDTLFPPRCFGCGRYGSFLCSSCDVSAPRLEQPFCRICAQPGATVGVCIECAHRPPPVEGIRVPYLMQGTIREGVHSLKYRNVRAAAPTLAGLLGPSLEPAPPGDALVPVPLHRKRLRRRGYNQSALLAREVGKLTQELEHGHAAKEVQDGGSSRRVPLRGRHAVAPLPTPGMLGPF